MRERRLLIVILLVVIVVVASLAAYITSPSWLPQGTTLQISSSSSAAESGSTLAFTAIVISGKSEVAGGTITWSASAGSLDKTTGITVLFTAPAVTSNVSVTLTAKFGGEGVYQPSTATVQVTVLPVQAKVTTLIVTPTTFQLHGGDTLALSASLSPSDAPSQLITWSISPSGAGSLSSTTGTSVTYTAPVVSGNTTVTIVASFPGDSQYTASSGSSEGTIVAPHGSLGKPTVMVVSPSSFSVQSNGTQVLNASVQDNAGNVLTGKTITWSISPSGAGSLSSTTGTSVTYTAPVVSGNTTVTIVASFAGDESYVGSGDSSTGTITPGFALSDLYVMTFTSAAMTNVTFQGPVVVDGMSVTNVTCDLADVSGFTLSHFGLTASEMTVDDLSLYVTNLTAYSPAFGGSMEITGGQTVSLGPTSSATFSNLTLYVVRMSATSVNLTRMEAIGERADSGSEPYIPSILSAQTATLGDVINIIGPVTYGDLADQVSNITTGTVDMSQFSFVHPISYSLNRSSREYNSTNRWLLEASRATGSNVSVYTIYFKTMPHRLVTVTATGSDNITQLLPTASGEGTYSHQYLVGCSMSMDNLEAHAVYFSADEVTLDSLTLSIE